MLRIAEEVDEERIWETKAPKGLSKSLLETWL
jgi:hypothetical protein